MSFSSFLLLVQLGSLSAQTLVDDANVASGGTQDNVFTETIKIISSSRKIFILTNNNQNLGPGDFVSLALDNNLAARAVVAKVHQGQAGVKILKIYSLTQWGRLRRNLEVQVVRGDDSLFAKKVDAKPTEATASKIRSEDDLYTGDVVVDDDVGVFDENKNRHVKPDNVVALSGSFFDVAEVEPKTGTVRATEFGASWAHQFADNFFVEGLYGRTLLDNYPGPDAQTLVNRLVGRLKFNIKGPLYTFFMPYVGFQTFTVSSPKAGKTNNEITNELELDAVDKLQKTGPVFGVTVLRRLVPGWFVKADIGSDLINAGFAIEF